MKNKLNVTQLCNILCVVLMLALVACHFLPFWTAPNKEGVETTYSVWQYVGFPTDNKSVTKTFENAIPEFDINDMVLMPSAAILLAAVAVVFVFKNSEEVWLALFPALVGALGIHAYLALPVYQMGNMWILPLIVSALMFAGAVAAIVFWFLDNRKKTGAK